MVNGFPPLPYLAQTEGIIFVFSYEDIFFFFFLLSGFSVISPYTFIGWVLPAALLIDLAIDPESATHRVKALKLKEHACLHVVKHVSY